MSAAEIAAELTVENDPDNAREVPDLGSEPERVPERLAVSVGFAYAALGDLEACGSEDAEVLVGSGLSVEGSLDAVAPGFPKGERVLLPICPIGRGVAAAGAALDKPPKSCAEAEGGGSVLAS